MSKIYLSNKELLTEIDRCKQSFCEITDPIYSNIDGFASSLDQLATSITDIRTRTGKITEPIIVRVMTNDHIPMVENPRGGDKPDVKAKVTFPPFKHYLCNLDEEPIEVGRSHWRGGLQNGEFDPKRGKMSNKLAFMFKTLVEKYSMRFNFRGYSYREDMQGQALMHLMQVGLQFDESKSNNAFSFYTLTIERCFIRVIQTEKQVQRLRDDLIEIQGGTPSHARQFEEETNSGSGQTIAKLAQKRRTAKKIAAEKEVVE